MDVDIAQQKHIEEDVTKKGQKSFKEKTVDEKKEKLEKLLTKYPSKVPVIFERHPKSKLPETPNLKYMSTKNLRLSYFAAQVRTALSLTPEHALFFSCANHKIIKHDALINELYETDKDSDGFLYIQYREVESFGRP